MTQWTVGWRETERSCWKRVKYPFLDIWTDIAVTTVARDANIFSSMSILMYGPISTLCLLLMSQIIPSVP